MLAVTKWELLCHVLIAHFIHENGVSQSHWLTAHLRAQSESSGWLTSQLMVIGSITEQSGGPASASWTLCL